MALWRAQAKSHRQRRAEHENKYGGFEPFAALSKPNAEKTMFDNCPWWYAGGALAMFAIEIGWHTYKAGGSEIDSKQMAQSMFIALIWPLSVALGVAFGVGQGIGGVLAKRKEPGGFDDAARAALLAALDPEDSYMPLVDKAIATILARAVDRRDPISVAEGRRLVVAALKAQCTQGGTDAG